MTFLRIFPYLFTYTHHISLSVQWKNLFKSKFPTLVLKFYCDKKLEKLGKLKEFDKME
jgi:hypothetical protein